MTKFFENKSEILQFLSLTEFADTATFGSFKLVGIFDNNNGDQTLINVTTTGTRPTFILPSVDVADTLLDLDDEITINSVVYIVRVVREDSDAMTTLELEEKV